MNRKAILFTYFAASIGFADVIDRGKLWTDSEVDAEARKWSETSVKERGAASQHEALAEWRANILNSDKLAQNEKIELLGNALRKISMFNIFQVAERIEVYDLAQSRLLSIPGHATYYRDKINALKEQLLSEKLSIEDWAEKKSPCFQVLGHLPSEETVEVLCGFAGDEFATGGSNSPQNPQIPGLKDWRFSDYAVDFTICLPAINALYSLQIENAPSVAGLDAEKSAIVWQQWWQEVKTGKRKYRFKGSSLEHPVNAPPGTAREVRRPERRPEASPRAKEVGTTTQVESRVVDTPSGPGRWVWMMCLALALVFGTVAVRWVGKRGGARVKGDFR